MKQPNRNKLNSLHAKIFDYFTRKPYLPLAFHISERYISGIARAPKEKKIKTNFSDPLPSGALRASFFKPNMQSQERILSAVREGQKKLGGMSGHAALLLPEITQKTFSFSFNALPMSQSEREQLIRFRIKKQLPLIPEDAKISYDVFPAGDSPGVRVVASVARMEVIKEYESLFEEAGIKLKMISTPVMGLINLLGFETASDYLLLNVEEEAFSLAAMVKGEFVLYRQKPFGFESPGEDETRKKVAIVIQEIENTMNFIEDREKRKIDDFWIRNGSRDKDKFFDILTPVVRIKPKNIAECSRLVAAVSDREQLAPLVGQLA
jgi:hypothetical protein